ncbi:phytanoyl-CoA dioxygenase family protein [Nocardioides daejeonensis]|uniref:phytanoyl-CoA dioxygenase family protein n=1 Tax=Nocardioides daejeonensis TaxID=1046556 RepID=UPI0013A5333D|nr:phytanoyl-CoA dioxygenase family protein [Nocardioides daejeonensis]
MTDTCTPSTGPFADDLLDSLPADQVAAAARLVVDAGSLAFRIAEGGHVVGYRVGSGELLGLERHDGLAADTVVALSAAAWADLVDQRRTVINLVVSGQLVFEKGGFDALAQWDPVLKLVHAGIPVFEPGRADLSGFDPAASCSLDDDDADLRARLSAVGYLHVRGVFSVEEMAQVNAEIDRLAALAQPGDGRSWWVTGEADEEVLCRLVYASQRSELLAGLDNDPRVQRLGRLLDPALRSAPDRLEGMAVLLKAPGKTQGLSNIPWHQDCGMGGHRILCPGVSIGIQVTGSSAATGNLLMVPGSHGQTLPWQWERQLTGVPVVAIDTEPGDVTVHIQDVMHASPQPTGEGGRRTAYVSFYPERMWEHVGPGEAFNDLVRDRNQEVAALQ